jgi:hypothetical protein
LLISCDLLTSSRCILLVDLSLACSLYVSPTYATHQDLFTDCSGHGRTVLSFNVGDIVARGTTGLSPSIFNSTQASAPPFSASLFRTTATANSSTQINQSTHFKSTLNVTCSDATTGRLRGPIALTPDSTVKRPAIPTPTASTTTNVPAVEASSPNTVNVLPESPHSTSDAAAPQSKPVGGPEGLPAEPVHVLPLKTNAGDQDADTPLPVETHGNPSVSITVIDLANFQSTQTSSPPSSAIMGSGSDAVTVIVAHGQTVAHSDGGSAVLQPETAIPGTLQLGESNQQATLTAVDSISDRTALVIVEHTLASDGEAYLYNGLTVSVLPSGSGALSIEDEQTSIVTSLSGSVFDLDDGQHATLASAENSLPATTVLGHTLSRLQNGNVLVDGTMVTAGSRATTIRYSAYSLDPDGRLEIFGSSSSAESLLTGSTNLTVSPTNLTTSSIVSAVTIVSGSSGNQPTSSMNSGASG